MVLNDLLISLSLFILQMLPVVFFPVIFLFPFLTIVFLFFDMIRKVLFVQCEHLFQVRLLSLESVDVLLLQLKGFLAQALQIEQSGLRGAGEQDFR